MGARRISFEEGFYLYKICNDVFTGPEVNMAKLIKIDYRLLSQAYANFLNITQPGLEAPKNAMREFEAFLHVKFNKMDKPEFVEEIANRVQWMAGPNAAVLYKAWRAKREA